MAAVWRFRVMMIAALAVIGIVTSAAAASSWPAFALIGPATMAVGIVAVLLFSRLRRTGEPARATRARDVLPLVGGTAIAFALGALGTRAVLLGILGALGVMIGLCLFAPVALGKSDPTALE